MGLLLFLGVKMLSPEPKVASQTLSFLLLWQKMHHVIVYFYFWKRRPLYH